MSETVEGSALSKEQARVRKIRGYYRERGLAGCFGVAMIDWELGNADKAVMSGDLAEMIKVYRKLQEIKG